MLAVSLCLSMIFCSTLPVVANYHKVTNSKITLLARVGGAGGGGGGSASGGSSGGGGGSSSGGSSGGGDGSEDGTWVQNDNTDKWYYYEKNNSSNGSKGATGWKKISGSWYYFGQDGAMYQNTTTPDGYYVDASGAWVK
ncbi:MAG: hypothetical protein IKP66_03025 [Lachnospiraceae bacterium]|nr:hypothetical protein [Lachnospiraceae bacterium]